LLRSAQTLSTHWSALRSSRCPVTQASCAPQGRCSEIGIRIANWKAMQARQALVERSRASRRVRSTTFMMRQRRGWSAESAATLAWTSRWRLRHSTLDAGS
jgi:hypothetical protein